MVLLWLDYFEIPKEDLCLHRDQCRMSTDRKSKPEMSEIRLGVLLVSPNILVDSCRLADKLQMNQHHCRVLEGTRNKMAEHAAVFL